MGDSDLNRHFSLLTSASSSASSSQNNKGGLGGGRSVTGTSSGHNKSPIRDRAWGDAATVGGGEASSGSINTRSRVRDSPFLVGNESWSSQNSANFFKSSNNSKSPVSSTLFQQQQQAAEQWTVAMADTINKKMETAATGSKKTTATTVQRKLPWDDDDEGSGRGGVDKVGSLSTFLKREKKPVTTRVSSSMSFSPGDYFEEETVYSVDLPGHEELKKKWNIKTGRRCDDDDDDDDEQSIGMFSGIYKQPFNKNTQWMTVEGDNFDDSFVSMAASGIFNAKERFERNAQQSSKAVSNKFSATASSSTNTSTSTNRSTSSKTSKSGANTKKPVGSTVNNNISNNNYQQPQQQQQPQTNLNEPTQNRSKSPVPSSLTSPSRQQPKKKMILTADSIKKEHFFPQADAEKLRKEEELRNLWNKAPSPIRAVKQQSLQPKPKTTMTTTTSLSAAVSIDADGFPKVEDDEDRKQHYRKLLTTPTVAAQPLLSSPIQQTFSDEMEAEQEEDVEDVEEDIVDEDEGTAIDSEAAVRAELLEDETVLSEILTAAAVAPPDDSQLIDVDAPEPEPAADTDMASPTTVEERLDTNNDIQHETPTSAERRRMTYKEALSLSFSEEKDRPPILPFKQDSPEEKDKAPFLPQSNEEIPAVRMETAAATTTTTTTTTTKDPIKESDRVTENGKPSDAVDSLEAVVQPETNLNVDENDGKNNIAPATVSDSPKQEERLEADDAGNEPAVVEVTTTKKNLEDAVIAATLPEHEQPPVSKESPLETPTKDATMVKGETPVDALTLESDSKVEPTTVTESIAVVAAANAVETASCVPTPTKPQETELTESKEEPVTTENTTVPEIQSAGTAAAVANSCGAATQIQSGAVTSEIQSLAVDAQEGFKDATPAIEVQAPAHEEKRTPPPRTASESMARAVEPKGLPPRTNSDSAASATARISGADLATAPFAKQIGAMRVATAEENAQMDRILKQVADERDQARVVHVAQTSRYDRDSSQRSLKSPTPLHAHWDCSKGVSGRGMLAACLAVVHNVNKDLANYSFKWIEELQNLLPRIFHTVITGCHIEFDPDDHQSLRVNYQMIDHEHELGFDILIALLKLAEPILTDWVFEYSLAAFEEVRHSERDLKARADGPVKIRNLPSSMIDIVGTVWCLDRLGVVSASCSPIPWRTNPDWEQLYRDQLLQPHLLVGLPIREDSVYCQMNTGVGVALMKVLTAKMQRKTGTTPPMTLKAVSAGYDKNPIQQGVNLVLGELLTDDNPLQSGLWRVEQMNLLEANIDDMTAEHLSFCMEVLLHKGAKDAWVTPIGMKKGRAAHTLHCLCRADQTNTIMQVIFRHSSTLGIRVQTLDRVSLHRKNLPIQTQWMNTLRKGIVNVKVGLLGDEVVSIKAEFDHCKKISLEADETIETIASQAIQRARDLLDAGWDGEDFR